MYPDYKGHRAKERTPEEEEKYQNFIAQLERLRVVLKLLGVDQLRMKEYEADDLVCAYVSKCAEDSSVIISSDKDLAQLVDKSVRYYILRKDPKIITMKNFKDEFGVGINDWMLLRSMVGDSSDNINGIQGVGEKTAAKLISKHNGDVADILADKKVSSYVEVIRRNLVLMALTPPQEDVFLDVDKGNLDIEGFRRACFELGFSRILSDFPAWIRPFVEFNAWRKK